MASARPAGPGSSKTHLNFVLPKVESMRPTGPASPSCTRIPKNCVMSVPGLKRFLQMSVCSSCTRSTCPSLRLCLKILSSASALGESARITLPWNASLQLLALGSVSRWEPMAVAGSAHESAASSRTTAHCSAAPASSSSRYSYSAAVSKASASGCRASCSARIACAVLRALSSATSASGSAAAPKKVATPITVVCPTVIWNLLFVLQVDLKNRMCLTAISTQSMVWMYPGVQAMPRSSAFASSWVTHTPRRSPCVALLTGFLNICIDLILRSCFSSGNSISWPTRSDPERTVPVRTVPWPLIGKQ
mmetsp:Transcript_10308/g.21873  ORF Transcript_10308/g.21873 Transcript_10308/m.21873 type:complete len:306 (+) Transcript_10308:467-1384(+)